MNVLNGLIKSMEDFNMTFSTSKINKKRLITTSIIMVIIDILLIGFGLFWQNEISLMAFSDSLWFAFAIQFFVAWMMFVYNQNILSFVVFGSITFLRMLIGKRPKQDYFTYMQMVEEKPIPKSIYIPIFISSLLVFIAALTSLIIIMN
jgi:hypothetical protein